MTDAVGYLATGDFVSFMSGNTTRLAVAVSTGDWDVTLRLAWVVIAFVTGNCLGVVVYRTAGRSAVPLMLCISALLCAAALSPFADQAFSLYATIVAMGALNAVVEQVNGLPIGLTYVTGALSKFGRGLGGWMAGRSSPGWRVQLVPWTGMFAGAVIGATLERQMGLNALWASGIFALVLGLVLLRIPRKWQHSFRSS